MTYIEVRKRAEQMREKGYSYSMIRETLGISQSTLSNWLARIPYTPNDEVIIRIGQARAKAGEQKHKNKLITLAQAEQYARETLTICTKKDILMFGLGIYLGEGEKNENVGIINSDPRVIAFMVKWLTEAWGLGIENLTLAIHLYPDNNRTACLQYWSEVSGVPLTQFGKTQLDKRANMRVGKRRKLPYGTAHLRVRSKGNKEFGVLLSRKIHAMMSRVSKMRA